MKCQCQIANVFNEYFSSVGKSVNDDFKNLQHRYRGIPIKQSMYLAPTNNKEAKNIVMSLKNTKSAGYDGLSICTLKRCTDNISDAMATAVNDVIASGCFPYSLKTAQVTPIHKKGDKSKIENYCPISILPAFSKVVEKVIHTRLMTFLSQHNLIFESQNGFMKNKSTSVAAAQLIDKIIRAIENKEYVTVQKYCMQMTHQ
ncbi:uncharacterized protein LOC126277826 [Schistocerca gregaria]|uniref:uncharacterized protein LOC126277826 n=1 Tax=Schistocerca gregaria TaxID=7010 RepID=UPI00211EC5C5|nr:uncharacterized protein LOC126277826 [Schistocerca gregaria]